MATSVHEDIASIFIGRHGLATELLPPAMQKRMVATGSQIVKGFCRDYQGSSKAPDTLFKYKQEDGNVIFSSTLEICFTETYAQLV